VGLVLFLVSQTIIINAKYRENLCDAEKAIIEDKEYYTKYCKDLNRRYKGKEAIICDETEHAFHKDPVEEALVATAKEVGFCYTESCTDWVQSFGFSAITFGYFIVCGIVAIIGLAIAWRFFVFFWGQTPPMYNTQLNPTKSIGYDDPSSLGFRKYTYGSGNNNSTGFGSGKSGKQS